MDKEIQELRDEYNDLVVKSAEANRAACAADAEKEYTKNQLIVRLLELLSEDTAYRCPTCGSVMEVHEEESERGRQCFCVRCNRCKSRGPFFKTKLEALLDWERVCTKSKEKAIHHGKYKYTLQGDEVCFYQKEYTVIADTEEEAIIKAVNRQYENFTNRSVELCDPRNLKVIDVEEDNYWDKMQDMYAYDCPYGAYVNPDLNKYCFFNRLWAPLGQRRMDEHVPEEKKFVWLSYQSRLENVDVNVVTTLLRDLSFDKKVISRVSAIEPFKGDRLLSIYFYGDGYPTSSPERLERYKQRIKGFKKLFSLPEDVCSKVDELVAEEERGNE